MIFDYISLEGEETLDRRVTVARLSIETMGGQVRPGFIYITGWCHLRREVRTFRHDLLINVRDPVTGECLAPGAVRALLLSHVAGRDS